MSSNWSSNQCMRAEIAIPLSINDSHFLMKWILESMPPSLRATTRALPLHKMQCRGNPLWLPSARYGINIGVQGADTSAGRRKFRDQSGQP